MSTLTMVMASLTGTGIASMLVRAAWLLHQPAPVPPEDDGSRQQVTQ